MNKKILILLPALALLLGGCQKGNTSSSGASQPTSSSSEEVAVEGVNISQTSATLDPGEKLQLSAVATPSTLSEKGVNWSTDAEGVATVSSGGLVTAVDEGTAHIKATAKADSTKSATCTITVNKAQVLVFAESIDLEKTYKLGLYQTQLDKNLFFNGKVIDSNGLRFDSSEKWTDAVDVKVEQKSAGVYNLAATIGEAKKYLCTVSATDYHAALNDTATTDWAWDETYHTFTTMVNGTKYFVGTNATYETLSFSDYSKYVASNDVIRLVYKVDKVNPTSVSIVEDKADVYAGGSVQLHAKAAPEGASSATIEWSVTGNNKVSVDQNGLVTAAEDAVVGSTATVKATWGELAGDTCVVTVKQKINYGTETNPLTIAQAKEVLDITGANLSEEHLWVKGYVASNTATGLKSEGKTRGTIWLTNDDGSVKEAFEVYAAYVDDVDHKLTAQSAGTMVGKEVIVHGFGKIFGGSTYELTSVDYGASANPRYDNPLVVAIDDSNPRKATDLVFDSESFEIEQGGSKQVAANTLPYASTGTVEYTIEPADKGVTYEEGKVKAAATATAGSYSLVATVKGTTVTKSLAFTVKEAEGGATSYVKLAELELNDTNGTFDASAKTQSFSANGITISSSTTATKLYYSPARFYKNVVVTVTSDKDFSKLELVSGQTDSGKWFAGTETISNSGVLAVDGFNATITFASPVKSFTFTCSANQVQINSIATYAIAVA